RLGGERVLALLGAVRIRGRCRGAGRHAQRGAHRGAAVLGIAVPPGALRRGAAATHRRLRASVRPHRVAALLERPRPGAAGAGHSGTRALARRGAAGGRVKLLLVGAGSHARTVVDLVQRCGHQITAYVDRVRQPRPWLGGAVPLEASDDDALADTRLAEVAEAPAMGLAGVRPDELARRLALFERYAAAFGAPPPA